MVQLCPSTVVSFVSLLFLGVLVVPSFLVSWWFLCFLVVSWFLGGFLASWFLGGFFVFWWFLGMYQYTHNGCSWRCQNRRTPLGIVLLVLEVRSFPWYRLGVLSISVVVAHRIDTTNRQKQRPRQTNVLKIVRRYQKLNVDIYAYETVD